MSAKHTTVLPSTAELAEWHLDCMYRRNAEGRMVEVNHPPGGRPPLVHALLTEARAHFRFRDDAPASLVEPATAALEALGGIDISAERLPDAIAAIPPLASLEGAEGAWAGPAFVVPELDPALAARAIDLIPERRALMTPHFAAWAHELADWQPCAAVVVAGVAVSECLTARLGERAAEAGVETAESHRGRGHALPPVARWATLIRAGGRVPLYSTSWDNAASRRVAAKLGLRQYGVDWHSG